MKEGRKKTEEEAKSKREVKSHDETAPFGSRCQKWRKKFIVVYRRERAVAISSRRIHRFQSQRDERRYSLHELRTLGASGSRPVANSPGSGWPIGSLSLQASGNSIFLDASSHLYKRVCPSVGPSVRWSVRDAFVKIAENGVMLMSCIRPCCNHIS